MRTVPRLIDSNSRLGEALMVFMVPLFLLRTIDPLFGLATAILACIVFVRTTLGKPDGYLVHRLYRCGLPLSGLPPRSARSFLR